MADSLYAQEDRDGPAPPASLPSSVNVTNTETPTNTSIGSETTNIAEPPLPAPPRESRFNFVPREAPPPPQNADSVEARVRAGQAKQEDLLRNLPPSPTPPLLQVKFDPPPKYVPVDMASSFGSLAATLGVLGGLLSRRPLTASLAALGSAMKGMQDGNTERYNHDVDTWKQGTEQALAQNKALVTQYELASSKDKNDFEKVMAQWRAIAAANQDEVQLNNIRMGDWKAASEHVDALNRTGMHLQEYYDKMDEHMMDPKRAAYRSWVTKLGRAPTYEEVLEFERNEAEIKNGTRGRGALNERYQNTVIRASNEVLRSLELVENLGITTGGGVFGAIMGKGTPATNLAVSLTRSVTPQEQQFYNAAMGGMALELSYVLNGGYKPDGGTVQKLESLYAVGPGDNMATASMKFADVIAKLHAALEVAPDFTPEQKRHRLMLIERLSKYRTPEEIREIYQGPHTENPSSGVRRGDAPPGGSTARTYSSKEEVAAAYRRGDFGTVGTQQAYDKAAAALKKLGGQ